MQLRSRRSDFFQKLGVSVQHFEQLDQGYRRFCLAIFVPRKRIHATTENFSGLALIEFEFFPNAGNEPWVDDGGIDLFIEVEHCSTDACRLDGIKHSFAT